MLLQRSCIYLFAIRKWYVSFVVLQNTHELSMIGDFETFPDYKKKFHELQNFG